MTLILLFAILFFGYGILLVYYWHSWQNIPGYLDDKAEGSAKVSVIIPARNEEACIGFLLEALARQSYPKELMEIIVVDDHSTDKTAEAVCQYPAVRLLRLQEDNLNSYKKKAIEMGIAAATGDWIVTTDADCVPPENWLRTMLAFRQETGAVFIAAPVSLDCSSGVLEIFQSMDFMVLQGITGAAVSKRIHAMCNGANLGYERKVFYEVGGFTGIDKIASGDDMLLMFKIASRYPGRVRYLKSQDAIVSTQPMKTWSSFLNQRIRWASKALYYKDKTIFWVLLLVYIFNLSFLLLVVAGFWNPLFWWTALTGWVLKTFVEWPFFSAVARFFNKEWSIKYLFPFQPLHILYTIVSGLFGQFGKYEWKGRRVR